MPDPGPAAHRLAIDAPLDAERVGSVLRDIATRLLPTLLPDRRWFGEKDRRIQSVTVDDLAVVRIGDDWVGLAVVGVGLDGGGTVPYFVPLSLVASPGPDTGALATLRAADRRYVVTEAFSSPSFATWFLDGFAENRELGTVSGRIVWRRFVDAVPDLLGTSGIGSPRLGTAEQSNTSVRYGDRVFLKVFRRLRGGVNPDEEVGRYLATETDFRRFPMPLGAVHLVDASGGDHALSLAQSFVPNEGDGWSFALRLLGSAPALLRPAAVGLGTRTAELHLALGAAPVGSGFAPEIVTERDTRRWEGSLRHHLASAISHLKASGTLLDRPLTEAWQTLLGRLPELERRAEGFRHQVGGSKIRVHGDYHLGQVLRTPDDDWTILDFEGEPLRSMADRKEKTSPLKDIAGMLRSFGYARSEVLRTGPPSDEAEALLEGEGAARGAFLAAYRETLERAGSDLVPRDSKAFGAAVSAWELDKAVYELRYELANRPDWVAHALTTMTDASVPAAGPR